MIRGDVWILCSRVFGRIVGGDYGGRFIRIFKLSFELLRKVYLFFLDEVFCFFLVWFFFVVLGVLGVFLVVRMVCVFSVSRRFMV